MKFITAPFVPASFVARTATVFTMLSMIAMGACAAPSTDEDATMNVEAADLGQRTDVQPGDGPVSPQMRVPPMACDGPNGERCCVVENWKIHCFIINVEDRRKR